MQRGSDLPAPSPEAAEHSARVGGLLRQRLAAQRGWISFADYMDLVLYAPGLGYYAAGARKFGAAGDFVTAPELGSLFARALARVAGSALQALGGGTILEVGGGTGALAADLLEALRDTPPDHYLLLELSADLRERQAATLAARVPDLSKRVVWLDRLPERPFRGVLIANEVLDALPVERFGIRDGQVLQWGVSSQGPGFAWAGRPAPADLSRAVREIESAVGHGLPEGYASELCPGLGRWMRSIAGLVEQGLALFVDYGCSRREYYDPGRVDGTLACHYRHWRHADPFLLPGLQDITAWVDFTAAAAAGLDAGLELAAYSTQAHFLLAAGLLEDEATPGADSLDALSRSRQIGQLLMPGQMGEHFKVLALSRGYRSARPLTLRDLRGRLELEPSPA